ncbi:DNA polymerase III, subunit gamma/tau [Alistipes finegoldii DSM 17242]|uniref:DNA polymerase III subunit gamma/tau n=1 Tax=Alistipes finegoldii (strain DSM 17242 / JCM 16770 / CCUG 46020 / CIP 107999 / KCTC 15236 / AHN 2437) TaxID=679935 RepID=I3YKI8_ALIFI|nr:DNA polymerase III subunit gamma/tau [Alistipes finegoldii]AFL77506.1 DNA polymerase III, subunit gamma/tau [Alistipes finegoldii DSM 17242]
MSDFIVSARKYRPATFASVVGQKHITSTLKNAIERAQLAHAYLFCGPRGVGKTTCARIFAKAINCLSPNGAEACNECESCRSFNEGRSLNIHELDAASNNSVEDIRTLIEQVRIIPQVGRYSVFIIDEVHMLSAAAFNAFLKTLEEPPAHAIFILATTEKHKIIPTILSRCQIYDFNRIRVEDSVEYLKYIAGQENISADEESLNLIAQKADGGMRDALSMFDKAVSFCGTTLDYRNVAQTLNVLDYDTYFSVTEMLLAGNYVDVLVTFDTVLSKGFSGQTFTAGLNRHMRDLLMAKRPETLRLIEMTGTLLERYRTQAGACNVEFLFGAISILTELDGKIRQSSNQRLLVELGLMKIAGLGQKKNDDLTSSGEYSLPALSPRTAAGAAATPTAAARPAPQQSASTVQAQTVSAAGQATPGTPQPGAGATVQAAVRPEAGQTAVRPDAGQAAAPPAAGQTAPSAVQPGAEQTGQGSVRPEAGPAASAGIPQVSGFSVRGATMQTAGPQAAEVSAQDNAPQAAAAGQTIPGGAANPAAQGGMANPAMQSGTPNPTAQGGAAGPTVLGGTAHPTAQGGAAVPAVQTAGGTTAETTPQPAPARPAVQTAPAPARRPLISGASLSELLASAGSDPDEELSDGESPDEAEAATVDPECAEKLEHARSRILNLIKEKRPRFVPAFELMTFRDNTISVSVPTTELREEILRSKTGMLMRIAELAGIEGMIELEVIVNEEIRAVRPIKLEDRVRYITEKNPLVAELRKALDLEVE